VRLNLILRRNGKVKESEVVRSSGSSRWDHAARATTLAWQMDRAKIRPSDLTVGRPVVIEFRKREKDIGVAAAVLRRASEKGSAWKSGGGGITYPYEGRRRHYEGRVLLMFTIGPDRHPRAVQVLQSSGFKVLDYAAVTGIQNWIAYPQFVGESCKVPIIFVLDRQ
jgi:TonB family protein